MFDITYLINSLKNKMKIKNKKIFYFVYLVPTIKDNF